MTIAAAVADIEAAAGAVEGLTTATLGEDLTTFPAVVVGPPTMLPGTGAGGGVLCLGSPAELTTSVFLIVELDEYAMQRLWDHTPVLWAALEENTPGVVTAANPGTYLAGATELPCYELVVEYPIGD